MARIDASVDRLAAALHSKGFEGPRAPEASEALDQIVEAVRPFALPEELARFWERVDPSSIGVTTFPELIGPSSALELHRQNRDPGSFPLAGPPLLFPIAYSSHVFRSIELASECSDGGTIFRWAWDESSFRVSHRSLSDLIETLAEAIAEGRLERRGGFAIVSSEPEEADAREISRELEAWPAHWLRASGVDLRDREPQGATHTIAALVDAAEQGPARGRIAGTITRLVGIGGDTVVLVDDGTRPLEVRCPAGTSPWRPVHGRRFEFEVTVEGTHEPAAVATDVRPID